MKKFEKARDLVPKPVIDRIDGSKIAVISYGSCDEAVKEARDYLENSGMKTDYLRLRSLPFTDEVRAFSESYDRIYVVEMNHTGQLHKILLMEYPELGENLISLTQNTGFPLTATWIKDSIVAKEEK